MRGHKTGPQCNAPLEGAHPLVRFLHLHLIADGMTRDELARKSGVPASTLKGWWHARRGVSPKVTSMENALGVFGYTLKPTPLGDKR